MSSEAVGEPGMAVLFTYTAADKTLTDVFAEGETPEDPVLRAEKVRDAFRDTFPEAIFAIGCNERARHLLQRRLLAAPAEHTSPAETGE